MIYDAVVATGTPSYSATGAKFSQSVTGATFVVNGADSFMSTAPTGTGIPGTGTVEAWVKAPAGSAVRVLFGHDTWYWIGADASNYATARFGDSSASPSVEVSLTSTTVIADGNWHHVALVFVTNSSVSLWVDGNRVANSASKPALGTDKGTRIASLAAGTYPWTAATIDEVRFSRNARYTGISYTVPTAPFTPDANTAALYHFDGDATNSSPYSVNILPNDPNIVYSPYNWDVTSARAKSINAGAYFRFLVNGSPTAINLAFDMTGVASPLPQVTVTIDGVSSFSAPIAPSVNVPLPSGPAWAKHHVQVTIKATTETQSRWNPQSTAVMFQGVGTSPITATTEPIKARKLYVVAFGDSITEGVRTLNMTATNDTDRNDATLGWAYHMGEKLGAEIGIVGFGATGISRATGSGGVPSLKNTVGSLWGGGPARDFTTNVPDAIVIMEGTNDATNDTTADMIAALNILLASTPSSTKIVVLRPFNGTSQAGFLQAAVAGCSAPGRVTYVDTNGWWSSADSSDALHPYGYTNVGRISGLAAEAVRAALNRGATFMNVGGAAKQVTPTRR